MARDYQRKKTKYSLPPAVYHQTLWQIRDYDRLRKKRDEILESSAGPPDGMPGGSGHTGDPTQSKAIRLAEMSRIVGIIDDEFARIPAEYRDGVWKSIQSNAPYPIDAARVTYSRWKSRFVCAVAKRLNLI